MPSVVESIAAAGCFFSALLPLQVRFNQSIFQTPELMQNIDIPSYVNVLGTPLDLTGLQVSSHAEWAALRHTSCDLLSGDWQWRLPRTACAALAGWQLGNGPAGGKQALEAVSAEAATHVLFQTTCDLLSQAWRQASLEAPAAEAALHEHI